MEELKPGDVVFLSQHAHEHKGPQGDLRTPAHRTEGASVNEAQPARTYLEHIASTAYEAWRQTMIDQRPTEAHPPWDQLHPDITMAWRDAMMTQLDDAPAPLPKPDRP